MNNVFSVQATSSSNSASRTPASTLTILIAGMNGGDGNQNPHNPGQALWLPQSSMITLEEYRRNQQQLASFRQSLAQMEYENEQAYRRYALAEQELHNRVEQGREAEYVASS